MQPRLKLFIPVFLIAAIGIFGLYYYGSGQLGESILLGLVAGVVIGAILSFAIPFLKKGREEAEQH